MLSTPLPIDVQNVAVLGHFADGSERVDGQIMRTRIVRDEFFRCIGQSRVISADTGFLSSRPLRSLWNLARVLRRAEFLVILPGCRGLRWLLPLYIRWKQRTGGRLHYLAIGGWLPRHLRDHPQQIPQLRACDGIYVQTRRMKKELEDLGLTQIHLLPNFRRFSKDRAVSGDVAKPIRLVFLSRVTEEKGLGLAVEAVKQINRQAGEPRATLTVYGPVQRGQEKWFEQLSKGFTPEIQYGGALQPNEIHDNLVGFDGLLFPTWYNGEGFPGVLVDAMIAGVPVIASNWIDIPEFVEEGVTGALVPAMDLQSLVEKIEEWTERPDQLLRMKACAASRALNFHVDHVWPDFMTQLFPKATSGIRDD